MKALHLVLGAAGLAVGLTLSLDARAQSCDPPRILFVIDSSSSMLNDATPTVTKWQAAQDAVHSVLTNYGDVAQYGLMTFPGEAGACTTGSVLVDVDVDTADSIEATLGGLDMQASRSTPAGQTLVAASNYDGITDPTYPNYVVFVSDGWQYCSIATSSAPVCATAADCTLMGEDPCPSCNSCQSVSSDPGCTDQNADGCYCVRDWPVLGVESLAAAGVTTYVVGFGSQVDALTLNAAADAGGTALPGCDATSSDPSCYYQATAPSELNAALADIVQQVVVDTCVGPCDIPGERTCTASGWSDCDAPSTIACTSECSTTGTQECVNGMLTECDAVCPDAGAAGAAGSSGGGGAGGAAGAGATGGAAGSAATGGTGGGTGGTGGPGTIDAGADDSGAAAGPPSTGGTDDSGDDGGCACRASGTQSGGASALFAALAAIGFAFFRRRR